MACILGFRSNLTTPAMSSEKARVSDHPRAGTGFTAIAGSRSSGPCLVLCEHGGCRFFGVVAACESHGATGKTGARQTRAIDPGGVRSRADHLVELRPAHVVIG